jgi:hypothetical protein
MSRWGRSASDGGERNLLFCLEVPKSGSAPQGKVFLPPAARSKSKAQCSKDGFSLTTPDPLVSVTRTRLRPACMIISKYGASRITTSRPFESLKGRLSEMEVSTASARRHSSRSRSSGTATCALETAIFLASAIDSSVAGLGSLRLYASPQIGFAAVHTVRDFGVISGSRTISYSGDNPPQTRRMIAVSEHREHARKMHRVLARTVPPTPRIAYHHLVPSSRQKEKS